jgi:hypothetical protein
LYLSTSGVLNANSGVSIVDDWAKYFLTQFLFVNGKVSVKSNLEFVDELIN